MKLLFWGVAFLATAYAGALNEQYLPPAQEASEAVEISVPSNEYLAPAASVAVEESAVKADDGYRYKTVRRFRNRNRRDVNELPSAEYLPPAQEASEAVEISVPSNEYLAPAASVAVEESAVKADDGYRYKTVRRFRNRNRRDVNELPSAEYLPPAQEASEAVEISVPSNEYLAPAASVAVEESAVKADDGYRYKTVRRFRNRNRRDVNELPSAEYLPPAQEASEAVEISVPSNEYLAPAASVAVEESAVKADDGYRYKTVRRFRNRNRRDVNELPSSEYLPPTQEASEAVQISVPSNEYLAPAASVAVEETAVKADDGYRYKTVRRFRNRNRRDVNELPSAEYLPPTQEASEAVQISVPSNEYLAPAASVAVEETAVKADDGYRYKTVRRFRNRNRRDVNELPSAEYLPPAQEASEAVEISVPSNEYLAPAASVAVEETAVKADDGYRYKTVRRFRNRNRRDVNELPSAEYLPPAQEASEAIEISVPSNEYLAPAASVAVEETAVKADDGYRYKTVRRFRNRNRRDVNELPSAEYLPPTQEASEAVEISVPSNEYLAPAASVAVEETAVKADDGYRYKTVRRFRNRNRRDVNELPSAEYLPPAQEASEAVEISVPSNEYLAPAASVAVEETAVKADDGYRYKTVRRFRNRNRRDVNELPSAEYLPPAQEASEAVEISVPSNEYLAPAASVAVEETAVKADDGYRYKTVRRFRNRNRRDVNELPSAEYLPPAQEASEAVEISVPSNEYLAPAASVAVEESAVKADDGYRYKTVRRFRNRNRRDVNELPSSEYLPPTQEASEAVEISVPSNEYLAPAASVAVEESAVKADDGYRYKTVRRFRNRNRRDVNELPSSEYLPPTQEASEAVQISVPSNEYLAPAASVAVEETAVKADDGYRYKTVRRFRNRNRRDVNELPSAEYLPPAQEASEAVEISVPSNEYLAPAASVAVEESAVKADDGYRYKTVRRFRNRNRRDVNELPSSEYLPPTQEASEAVQISVPSNEYLAPAASVAVEETAVKADDGYRYKTVRRFRNRNRRDVNELPSAEYLPPAQEASEAVEISVPSNEYLAPAASVAVEETAVKADDGYRYKTVRRFRNRNRRDVNELPSAEYLPPAQEASEAVEISVPSNDYLAPSPVPEEIKTEVANDGYRYKTVKRFKVRRN